MRANIARALTAALAITGAAGAIVLPTLTLGRVESPPPHAFALPAPVGAVVIEADPLPAAPAHRRPATRPAPAVAPARAAAPRTARSAPSAPTRQAAPAPLAAPETPATPTPALATTPEPLPTPEPAPQPAPEPLPAPEPSAAKLVVAIAPEEAVETAEPGSKPHKRKQDKAPQRKGDKEHKRGKDDRKPEPPPATVLPVVPVVPSDDAVGSDEPLADDEPDRKHGKGHGKKK